MIPLPEFLNESVQYLIGDLFPWTVIGENVLRFFYLYAFSEVFWWEPLELQIIWNNIGYVGWDEEAKRFSAFTKDIRAGILILEYFTY